MKPHILPILLAGLLASSVAVSAAEVGGIVTPAKDIGKLSLVAGTPRKSEASLEVYLFFDPALPGAKNVLRMVDSIYEQSLENKDKPVSFCAISRTGKARTAALELSKFRMPVYGDDNGDVYPEFAGTEVVIPFALVSDGEKIVPHDRPCHRTGHERPQQGVPLLSRQRLDGHRHSRSHGKT